MRKVLTILIIYFSVLTGFTQTPLLKELKLNFNGKSMPVTCVIMDREGVLWLGNQLGVFTYNGYQLNRVYEANRLSKEVVTLFEDSGGFVWAGTISGEILRFREYNQVNFNPTGGMPKTRITAIAQDLDSNIWFSTSEEGVFVFHRRRMYNFNISDGLSNNSVYCMLSNIKGTILCGTDKGINYLSINKGKKNILKKLDGRTGLFGDTITSLSYFENGILVVGTGNRGAYMYYENRNKYDMLCDHSTPVSSICVLGNEVWLGTQDNGIIDCEFYPHQKIRNLNLAESYGIVKIQKMINTPFYFQLVLAEHKLYVVQGEWFQKISLPDENPNPKPRAITVGGGYIYALYSHGMFRRPLVANENWMPVYLSPKIDFNAISSMVMDQYGDIWLGSLTEGLICIDRKNIVVKHLTQSKGLLDNSIFKLKAVKNTLYYGCRNGLGFIPLNGDNKPVKFGNQLKKTAMIPVYDFCFSSDSNAMWLATDGKGIIKLTDQGVTSFLDKLPDDSKVIYSLQEDRHKKIWYTSLNYGLYKLNENGMESINFLKNINYSAINALFIDKRDNIITVHDDFISIYNAATRQQYSQAGEFGFTSPEFTIDMVAAWEDNYYIMSRDGIYVYQPDRFDFMQNLPAFINRFNVNLQPVSHSGADELKLSYDKNNLNIQLFTPWYGNHDKIKYMYVLEGLNTDTVLTSDNNLNFPNLRSGSYALKVRPVIIGSNINTKWSVKRFIINKPWFKTTWFIVLFALTGFIILYFINYNFLKNQNRSNEIERQRLRQEIKILNNQINPHFLFNSLNNLISIIDIDTVNAKIYTAHLADFYRLIVAYKDNYVITLEEDLKISRIFIALQNIRFSDAIIYKVMVPDAYFKCYVPPLTLQILVENAIKHNKVSQSQPLHIDITIEKEFLIVRNKISPKENLETSTKSGIRFIVDRFDFVTKSKPVIVQTETEFVVKIPLIYTEPLPV